MVFRKRLLALFAVLGLLAHYHDRLSQASYRAARPSNRATRRQGQDEKKEKAQGEGKQKDKEKGKDKER